MANKTLTESQLESILPGDIGSPRKFVGSDLLMTDDETKLRNIATLKANVHFGQLKLLISEISFLTIHWNPITHPKPTILYIGAAPGYHLGALTMLFPEFNYILYDGGRIRVPKEVEVKSEIYSGSDGYFTDAEAQKYVGRNDIFFISDIRGGVTKTPDLTNEAIITRDMYTQSNWVEMIRPVEALLKFRTPYYVKDVDILIQRTQDNYLQNLAGYTDKLGFRYLYGYLYKQMYAPKRSTELRLVPIKKGDSYTYRDYNILDVQNQCNYFNTVIRDRHRYLNPATDKPGSASPGYVLDDYDGTAFAYILTKYMQKRGQEVSKKSLSDLIAKVLDKLYSDMEAATDITITGIIELKEAAVKVASIPIIHSENSVVNLRDLIKRK